MICSRALANIRRVFNCRISHAAAVSYERWATTRTKCAFHDTSSMLLGAASGNSSGLVYLYFLRMRHSRIIDAEPKQMMRKGRPNRWQSDVLYLGGWWVSLTMP